MEIVSAPYLAEVEIGDTAVRAPIEYVMSFVWAAFLGLRSLDLVHISYSWVLKVKKRIGVFVTTDDEIASKKTLVQKRLGVKIAHIKEM